MTMENSTNWNVPDKNGNNSPSSQLDIYQEVIDSTDEDDFLARTNFGLGNYREAEMWQQTQEFHRAQYASAAFERRLTERALDETKRELGERGWTYTVENDRGERKDIHIKGWRDLPEDERESPGEPHKRSYVREQGEEVWDNLPPREQQKALKRVAGFTDTWTPPHKRQMIMRHEASRSRNARLLDNLFDRVREVKGSAREVAEEMMTLGGDN